MGPGHQDRRHQDRLIMAVIIRSPKSVLAGLLFFGIGGGAATIAREYRMGTALHMGPGYFPFALGLLLALVGAAAVVQGLSVTGPPLGKVALRPAVVITGAVVAFALMVERFGLVPACVVAVLLGSFADKTFRPVQSAVLAVALAAAAGAIFVYGLKLPLTLFG